MDRVWIRTEEARTEEAASTVSAAFTQPGGCSGLCPEVSSKGSQAKAQDTELTVPGHTPQWWR